jgi:hypothetical protein
LYKGAFLLAWNLFNSISPVLIAFYNLQVLKKLLRRLYVTVHLYNQELCIITEFFRNYV